MEPYNTTKPQRATSNCDPAGPPPIQVADARRVMLRKLKRGGPEHRIYEEEYRLWKRGQDVDVQVSTGTGCHNKTLSQDDTVTPSTIKTPNFLYKSQELRAYDKDQQTNYPYSTLREFCVHIMMILYDIPKKRLVS
ncbi:hypothetical protein TWF730_008136 [Orbilia blumenaviensis]|uniref:Uncharacterized protein n=1 Tax=Orbilia blumenaviensis TaxID=1796055 RepID=A0AAV9VBL5_9PEZI